MHNSEGKLSAIWTPRSQWVHLAQVGWGHADWVLSTNLLGLVQVLEAVAHILPLLAHRQWVGLVHASEVGAKVFNIFKYDVATAKVLCRNIRHDVCLRNSHLGGWHCNRSTSHGAEWWSLCGPVGH